VTASTNAIAPPKKTTAAEALPHFAAAFPGAGTVPRLSADTECGNDCRQPVPFLGGDCFRAAFADLLSLACGSDRRNDQYKNDKAFRGGILGHAQPSLLPRLCLDRARFHEFNDRRKKIAVRYETCPS
jgi:hypothetical protein